MTAEEFKNRFNSTSKSLRYKRRIIEHIIDEGPETLPILSRKLELSVPTTSKYVNEMIDVVVDPLADLLEALGGVLKLEWDIHHLLYLIATEVHHHHVHLPLGEVHAEEVDVTRIRDYGGQR